MFPLQDFHSSAQEIWFIRRSRTSKTTSADTKSYVFQTFGWQTDNDTSWLRRWVIRGFLKTVWQEVWACRGTAALRNNSTLAFEAANDLCHLCKITTIRHFSGCQSSQKYGHDPACHTAIFRACKIVFFFKRTRKMNCTCTNFSLHKHVIHLN